MERLDVLVIGAGLSGIGAAYHLKTECPELSYAILEGREAIGGTWDLFRYPGVRSDSDMFTLGYRFRPWKSGKAIADGASIKAYIEETAADHGITEHIRFGHRVVRAEWSSESGRWTVIAKHGEETRRFSVRFLYACTGYYDYERGYTPDLPGLATFGGTVVHPQHWPQDLDWSGKRIVVIGSGATAITLVPALADRAASVTMLQRSPTYVAALPSVDRIAEALQRVLPGDVAHAAARWKNVLRGMFYYGLAKSRPELMKRVLKKEASRAMPDVDVNAHFTPRYDPWDERLCVAPDGDLFRTLQSGKANVVTDRIAKITETGIALESGKTLETDILITATGLNARLFCGLDLVVDGTPVKLSETVAYKGMMYSGVPNLASAVGYTNASWTLKCDLTAEHVCRLLNFMRDHHVAIVTPRAGDDVETEPLLDLKSGYVQRALDTLPRQGKRAPWRLHQSYVRDLLALRFGRVDEPELVFTDPTARRAQPTTMEQAHV